MKKQFSPMESKIIKIVGRKAMTIGQITGEYYRDVIEPFGARNKIAGSVRRINQKCDFYKLNWYLGSNGSGAAGKTVWKEKR